ncbi:MAG: 50S ribosomal protein L5 [Rhodothermaeota bacterium MED-G12]|jgi:large subunit ribosomal protein L5|nr:50S ribosomal protein L5 [Balneola sp.]MDC0592499.1 50S ribosomal protein L5 [Balneolaceae bacterium]MDC3296898.1 50S ribosomal protein L5 [Balneolaceae bacterium]PDH54555.1 MAG: 50S ribosomal protein L5 [Rhodothermaeota bacterium MED-G12]|tara:strand:+ start:1119 stop:1667 length:549 start_codon:yes stop_codon:yes gene_type:complete
MADSRLYTIYKDEIISKLTEEFQYTNIMAVPKLEKIVLNVGVGEAIQDKKVLDTIVSNMALITGQQPVTTKAKKSISNFKLREGMPIGCKATLRGRIMYEFLDRLVTLALPRTRDFQGVPDKSFDGRGNYTMGIKEHTIFPEIDTDKVTKMHGMDVTFVTSAETDEEAYALLKHFGMPFKNI